MIAHASVAQTLPQGCFLQKGVSRPAFRTTAHSVSGSSRRRQQAARVVVPSAIDVSALHGVAKAVGDSVRIKLGT